MTDKAAFQAVFSDWRLVRSRKCVQISFEIPLEHADAAYKALGGMPNSEESRWFAIARLTAPVEAKTEKENGHKRQFDELPLPQQAALACNDPRFQAFIENEDGLRWSLCLSAWENRSEAAAEWVRGKLEISSRSELKSNPSAAQRWKNLYTAFLAETRI